MGQVTFNEDDGKNTPRKKEVKAASEPSKITSLLIERGVVSTVEQANMVLIAVAIVAILLLGGIIIHSNRPPVYNDVQNIPPDQI